MQKLVYYINSCNNSNCLEILKNANLATTSTKKVIQKLEKSFGTDLSEKKKIIDQMVMDYVNNKGSESENDDDDDDEEVSNH